MCINDYTLCIYMGVVQARLAIPGRAMLRLHFYYMWHTQMVLKFVIPGQITICSDYDRGRLSLHSHMQGGHPVETYTLRPACSRCGFDARVFAISLCFPLYMACNCKSCVLFRLFASCFCWNTWPCRQQEGMTSSTLFPQHHCWLLAGE